jgi:hypothetical protein
LAAGFLLLYFTNTPLTTAISCALIGAMYGLGMSYYMMRGTIIVPPSQILMAISVRTMFSCAAGALSTYISLLLRWLFKTLIIGIMPVLAIILAVGAVLSFAMALGSRKNGAVFLESGLEN